MRLNIPRKLLYMHSTIPGSIGTQDSTLQKHLYMALSDPRKCLHTKIAPYHSSLGVQGERTPSICSLPPSISGVSSSFLEHGATQFCRGGGQGSLLLHPTGDNVGEEDEGHSGCILEPKVRLTGTGPFSPGEDRLIWGQEGKQAFVLGVLRNVVVAVVVDLQGSLPGSLEEFLLEIGASGPQGPFSLLQFPSINSRAGCAEWVQDTLQIPECMILLGKIGLLCRAKPSWVPRHVEQPPNPQIPNPKRQN